MKSELLKKLLAWVAVHVKGQDLIVAYSGGQDSHVLLHALWQCRLQMPIFELSAIHINHGLQSTALEWEAHCKTICQSLAIPLEIIALHVQKRNGASIEAQARMQRYQAFAKRCTRQHLVLSAHTQNDQAETLLLQLLRGSGPLGLAGIAPRKPLGNGSLVRPFLDVSRTAIAAYAQQHRLQWVEDHSNADVRFRRNFLRHHILPVLANVVPGIYRCIARSSTHCAHTQQLLEEYLDCDLKAVCGEVENTLNVSSLKTLSPLKQAAVVRRWLHKNGVILPATRKLQDLLSQMLHAKVDADPCIAWAKIQIRRYKGLLYIVPTQAPIHPFVHSIGCNGLMWDLSTPLHIGDTIWKAHKTRGRGLSCNKIPKELKVALRQGGERCRIQGHAFSRSLKKIIQDYAIPSWQRPTLPLFYHDHILVAVAHLFLCEGWQVHSTDEMGWVIEKISLSTQTQSLFEAENRL